MGAKPFLASGLRSLLPGSLVLSLALSASAQELNDSWTVSIGTQVVPVASDGSFLIPNVSTPDQFGAGGPGTPPDLVSDEFVRVVGCGYIEGQTMWAFSEGFNVRQGETYHIGALTFTAVPPPLPVELSLSFPSPDANVGETLQATVTGLLGSGQVADLTSATSWTAYKSSNPSIAVMSPDGMLLARAPGLVHITATNDSVTAVKLVRVVSVADPLTTIVGLTVLDEDKSLCAGAEVSIVGQPYETISTDQGNFAFEGVATRGAAFYTVRATKQVGDQFFIGSKIVELVPGGLSDAGILELKFVDATEVVFVLDTSGSITSRPICQLVTGVNATLQQVSPNTITTAYGITALFPGGCSSASVLSALGGLVPGSPGTCGPILNQSESWGPATAIVAMNYSWQTNVRIIVPISDEAPCGGGTSCDTADNQALANALALCQANGVTVLPVMGFETPGCVQTLAQAIALGTGGSLISVDTLPGGYASAQTLLVDLILGVAGQ